MPDGPLPFTPRALRADHAALYCGVSEGWWRAAVTAGRAPAPIYLSERVPVWLRDDLDRWLDARRASPDAARPEAIDDDIRALAARLATPKRAARRP